MLYTDLSHYSPDRSMYLAERSLSSIYTGGPTDFKPSMALDFFPRLLSISLVKLVTYTVHVCAVLSLPSSILYSFFNAEDGAEAIQQLRCYCYMHRLLLQFLKTYPTLIDNARDSVIEFIEKPNSRQVNYAFKNNCYIRYIIMSKSISENACVYHLKMYFNLIGNRNIKDFTPEIKIILVCTM